MESPETDDVLENERNEALRQLEGWLEIPMVFLGFVWLTLLVIELIWGVSPFLETLSRAIWIAFIVDFLLKIVLAPHKLAYIRSSWLTVISLVVPALRVFRIVRVIRLMRLARVSRGLRLVRLITSLNRGMKALSASMGRRGFGYAVLLTVIVVVAGAAAMYAFERGGPSEINTFGQALWWTGMLMTSIGTEFWPQTPEGKILCFLLSLYGLGIFGYITATIASFFIGRDAEEEHEVAGARLVKELRTEVAAMRADLQALSRLNERRFKENRDE